MKNDGGILEFQVRELHVECLPGKIPDTVDIDVSALEPQVALPGGVQNAVDIREAAGTKIDHAFLGSCGSGMYEDMQTAAALLRGRRIAPHVRMFIAPGSEASMRRLARVTRAAAR